MGKITGICALIAIFSVVALCAVFNKLYLPTRDKLSLAEQKINSYEKKIEEYRYAEIQTAETIQLLKNKISEDKEALDWSSHPVPASIINILRETHERATGNHTSPNRMYKNNKK